MAENGRETAEKCHGIYLLVHLEGTLSNALVLLQLCNFLHIRLKNENTPFLK